MPPTPNSPAWERLYEIAASQAGFFALDQAEASGYSSQHLHKHLRAGRIYRVYRGIYRLAQFPDDELGEFVALWLWSGRVGAFSHETSLFLHDLSDALPTRAHMTVPTAWRTRRLRVPDGLVLHYDDLAASQRTWVGVVPTTSVHQAITESITAHVAPDLVAQAIREARRRGLISATDGRSLSLRLRRTQDPQS